VHALKPAIDFVTLGEKARSGSGRALKKQCTLDGEADHILAARFLKRFVDDMPWLHVDGSVMSPVH
jgi:hypothetical protein